MSGLAKWLSLVRFSHSIFALPFALASAWLAARGTPPLVTLAWILLCAVSARTAAMAFNRWLDRDLDAANPRTAGREIPRGVVAPGAALALTAFAAAAFVLGAFALGPLAGALSFPVLGVLLGYSAVKRWSWAAHLVLGLALGLAPLGAWVAVRGNLAGDLVPPLLLAAAVLCWVAGFDLIYACQDADFDRAANLHSIPARFGVPFALRLSSALHVVTLVLLALVGWRAELGWAYGAALAVAALLFVWQHRLVAPDDLSRVNLAFFTLNGWVGVGVFLGVALDLYLAHAPAGGRGL